MKLNRDGKPAGFQKILLVLLAAGAVVLLVSPVFAETGVTIPAEGIKSCYLGENIVLRGLNPDSDTIYLFLTGPNLPASGAALTSPDKAAVSQNPDSFTAVRTKPDKTWVYSWQTANLRLDAGTYTIYAVGQPKTKDQLGPKAASAEILIRRPYTGVTVSADGDQSYYLGENIILRGLSPDADTVYLFLTGPNLPASGAALTTPDKAAVSQNPDSFTAVRTKPDYSWEYPWYTANLKLDAGTYTVYAVGQPEAKDNLGPGASSTGIIVKKPFITGEIQPAAITKREPFTVSGTAEGEPPSVQVWIFGENMFSKATVSVNPDASFRYAIPGEVTQRYSSGQFFAIVQHSMQDNQFDINVDGEFVQNKKINNGTVLFKVTGAGSLQGTDAADALAAAFTEPGATDDTYTIIPFQVSEAGSTGPRATIPSTAPGNQQSWIDPMPFALVGGMVLVLGLVVWSRK